MSASGVDTSSQVAGRRGLWAVIRCRILAAPAEAGTFGPSRIGRCWLHIAQAQQGLQRAGGRQPVPLVPHGLLLLRPGCTDHRRLLMTAGGAV